MNILTNNIQIKSLDFDNSFKNLNEYWKEQNGLGVISFYETNSGEFFIVHIKNCQCCYGNSKSIFWILDSEGNVIREETEDFYKKEISQIKSIFRFKIPERLTKNYFHFSIK